MFFDCVIDSYYDSLPKGTMKQVLSLKTILTGVVGALVTLSALDAEARTVVVLDETVLPPNLVAAHPRLQAAIVDTVRGLGWIPIVGAAPPLDCDGKPGCYSAAAAASGSDAILRVTGGRTASVGYDLTVQLSTAQGGARSAVGSCSFCSSVDLTRIAEKVVREVFADGPPSPPAAAPATTPAAIPPATVTTTPPPAPLPVAPTHSQLVMPLALGAGGAALLVAGVSLWALDGSSDATSSCSSPAKGLRNCNVYNTETLGIVFTAAGAAAAVVAGVLVYRTFHDSREVSLSIGPTGIAMGGRF